MKISRSKIDGLLLLFLIFGELQFLFVNQNSDNISNNGAYPIINPAEEEVPSIGSKNAPITYNAIGTSGGFVKKVWQTTTSYANNYKMVARQITDSGYEYVDFNQADIPESNFNAIKTPLISQDGSTDETLANIGDLYGNEIEYEPGTSTFQLDSISARTDENGVNTGTLNLPTWGLKGINTYDGQTKIIESIPRVAWSNQDGVTGEEDPRWPGLYQPSDYLDLTEQVLAVPDTHQDKWSMVGTRVWYGQSYGNWLGLWTTYTSYIDLTFSVNMQPADYTGAKLYMEFFAGGKHEPMAGRVDDYNQDGSTMLVTYHYDDGSTSTDSANLLQRNSAEMGWKSQHFLANYNYIKAGIRITSIDVQMKWISPFMWTTSFETIGIIDTITFVAITAGYAIATTGYQVETDLPYNELSSFGGVDLANTQIRNNFADQISAIHVQMHATFPTNAVFSPPSGSGEPNRREFSVCRVINNNLRTISDLYEAITWTFTSTNGELDVIITDRTKIILFLYCIQYFPILSPNYIITTQIHSARYAGKTEDSVKLDYFRFEILLRDYSEGAAETSLKYERDNQSKMTWTFTKQVYEKWGLTPLTIILEGLPLDHTIISSTWTRTEEIIGTRKSIILDISGSLPEDAEIITESPNYLEQITIFAIKDVMVEFAGMMTITMPIQTSTFLKETKIRVNVSCGDFDYLGSEAFLHFNLELNAEIKYNTLLDLWPDTDLRNYSLDINLNQIETLERGMIYDQFALYINSNNPDEAGFLFLPASFEIRKNNIINPAFEWGDTYFNYTFGTNASAEYSVLVIQYNWKWHPEDYIFESNAKNFTANLTSGAILLSNMSLDFPFIFDNIDRHRNYPNPTFTFYFNNTDLEDPYDLILDEVSVVPYFYYEAEPAKSRILFNRTDFEPATIDPNTEIAIPVNFNYTQCNQTFQRGVYRVHVEFHETNSEHNSTYFNATILMDGDYNDIGNILNFTIHEGLIGEQVITGNFTKNADTSAIACYIMDKEGYGDGSFLSFDQHGVFYGNQESPQVTLISPKSSETYATSLIPVNSRIYDPDFNKDNASMHLYNEKWDFGWLDYPNSGDYHLLNINPFALTTGRIYIEVLARDFTLNYAFATGSFYCESYKDAIINTTQIYIGNINAMSTIQKVPCRVFVNFSNYDVLTRRIQLGSDYADATDLIIQRSPLDIYRAENHPELGMSPIGETTYWKFDYATSSDNLTFALNSPIAEWSPDNEFSTPTRKVFTARIKRHTNLRTYTNVHIVGDFNINLQNIEVFVTDTTGGENITLTYNSSLIYGYIGKYNEYFRVNFTVPLILKGTDYAFKIAIVERTDIEIKNYASGFLIGIMIGAVGAGVIRELIRILKRQPKPKGRNQILRTYLPAILIGVALGCVAGYFWLSG